MPYNFQDPIFYFLVAYLLHRTAQRHRAKPMRPRRRSEPREQSAGASGWASTSTKVLVYNSNKAC